MPFQATVNLVDGTPYTVRKLLSAGSSITKLDKSDKAGVGYLTFGLALAPASVSGYNLCPNSSAECRMLCLHTSGQYAIWPEMIANARIAKSRLFMEQRSVFLPQLIKEIASAERKATKASLKLCMRLNVLSDVQWERVAPEIFATFPSVQFYDYTKISTRMFRYLSGKTPKNLHLTFSRSETNEVVCKEVLRSGGNVAVPFQVKYFRDKRDPLPSTFMGRPVLDGDITDLRFLDRRARKGRAGYIVGLRAKGRAKKMTSNGFVVQVA